MNQPTAPCRPPRMKSATRRQVKPFGISRRTANQATPTKKTRPRIRPSSRCAHSQKKMNLKPARAHSGRPGDLAKLGCRLVERELAHPVGVGERRDRADDRLPFGDRQSAFRKPGDAADHNHPEHQGGNDEEQVGQGKRTRPAFRQARYRCGGHGRTGHVRRAYARRCFGAREGTGIDFDADDML